MKQEPEVTVTSASKKAKNSDAKWQEFLMEVKNKNNSIHAVLKVCEADFDGNVVCLTFPYKFHKERIEDNRNKQVVEDVLTSVYGDKYLVKCLLKPNMNVKTDQKPQGKDDLLEDALDVFGGEVVE
jgi:DNA polymerase-3 subunit gamma/tau